MKHNFKISRYFEVSKLKIKRTNGTKELFASGRCKRKVACREIPKIARRKLGMLHYASCLRDCHSIRINNQWRVVFRWSEQGAQNVCIIDYHCEKMIKMIQLKRKPTSPGQILKEEFLVPLNMSQKEVAQHIGCDVKVINRIVNERVSFTATMALKLAAAFNTSPDFWLNAQKALDIYQASKQLKRLPKPFRAVA